MGYVEVRGDGDRLLFRYDPDRRLVEIKPRGGRVQVVDLMKFEGVAPAGAERYPQRDEGVRPARLTRVDGLGKL